MTRATNGRAFLNFPNRIVQPVLLSNVILRVSPGINLGVLRNGGTDVRK